MSDITATVNRLIEVARRLRDMAGKLEQLEIKSQIVDEISTLQEIRDAVSGELGHDRIDSADTEVPADDEAVSVEAVADAGIGVVKPTGNEETYSLTPEGDDESLDATASAEDEPENDAAAPVNAESAPTIDERRAILEMRIADLEQLEQAATRRMNDVPTTEQKQIKAKAQKAGREAGKSGKELQQYALGAMRLSPEQRSELQAARKDVLSLREAIEKERASLDSVVATDS